MLTATDVSDLLYEACSNAIPGGSTVIDVPIFGDTDLKTLQKIKWNGITLKKKNRLWQAYNNIVMIGLYSYELAYLINNSDKKAIILERREKSNACD